VAELTISRLVHDLSYITRIFFKLLQERWLSMRVGAEAHNKNTSKNVIKYWTFLVHLAWWAIDILQGTSYEPQWMSCKRKGVFSRTWIPFLSTRLIEKDTRMVFFFVCFFVKIHSLLIHINLYTRMVKVTSVNPCGTHK